MANTDDLVSSYVERLDELIGSNMGKLVATDRNGHDKLAGLIAGLMTAKKEIEGLAKKWRLKDGEDD